MKKLKYLVILLIAALVIPFTVHADGEESKEVKLYFFRGEGCPHCEEAEEWFKTIEEEYGSYFEVVDYETWYNQENAELMQNVAKARGEEANGVPYIIVGNQSWNGFAQEYAPEILAKIQEEFEKDVNDRYDIMKLLPTLTEKKETSVGTDVLALVVILLVFGGICYGVYRARKRTK